MINREKLRAALTEYGLDLSTAEVGRTPEGLCWLVTFLRSNEVLTLKFSEPKDTAEFYSQVAARCDAEHR